MQNPTTFTMASTWLILVVFSTTAWAHEHTQWQQPVPQECPSLYQWTDTCNAYVLKDGTAAIVLTSDGHSLAFSGDVMLDGARMHTWFDTEWDYGFARGVETLIDTVDQLATEAPDVMLPSHGPVVSDPKTQLAGYAHKLRELKKRYVRGYPVSELKDQQRDPLSRPTVVPEIFQVTPHLYKFNRPGEGSNFSIIVADSGWAIISDCGLMSAEFLDRALAGMQEHLGLKTIDAMIISHILVTP